VSHIVIGKTGSSRIRAQLFGSVAMSMVQMSPQPVTVVP
jgi:nucleotide-binding universal stress UspA family protein